MKDSLEVDSSYESLHSAHRSYSPLTAGASRFQHLPGGSECVLVVDDNRVLAESTRRLLAELGYEARACTDPLQARTLVADDSRHDVDLLLTDYAMPHMNGYELAQRLREGRPDLRVLLCSSWSEDVLRREHPGDDWLPFIEKPFTLEALAARVREVLDSESPIPCHLNRRQRVLGEE